jgi:hypothetical protein
MHRRIRSQRWHQVDGAKTENARMQGPWISASKRGVPATEGQSSLRISCLCLMLPWVELSIGVIISSSTKQWRSTNIFPADHVKLLPSGLGHQSNDILKSTELRCELCCGLRG